MRPRPLPIRLGGDGVSPTPAHALDPLTQHIQPLRVLGLIGHQVLWKPDMDHPSVIVDLHDLDEGHHRRATIEMVPDAEADEGDEQDDRQHLPVKRPAFSRPIALGNDLVTRL